MRRVLMVCTAASLLGVLSALLDYALAHGLLWSSERTGLRQEIARLASDLLSTGESAAMVLNITDALQWPAPVQGHAPPPILAASMTPVHFTAPQADDAQEINRDLKADRVLTEIAVPKLIIPQPEPLTEGVSAALFMLSPAIPPAPSTAAPAPSTAAPAPVLMAAASTAIVAGPVASGTRMSLPVNPPAKNPFVTSAAAAAATPSPAKYGWNDLVRMASMKGGDGEEPNRLFGALSEKEFRARELRCMATAIYFEARGESVRGQIAVGQVIMTRVRSNFFPNTICGVVFQGQWNRNACQFSFACDGTADVPKEKEEWVTALDVAKQVVSGKVYLSDIGDATHYHAIYVRPDWVREVKRIKQIGVHIFYKAPFVQPLAADPTLQGM